MRDTAIITGFVIDNYTVLTLPRYWPLVLLVKVKRPGKASEIEEDKFTGNKLIHDFRLPPRFCDLRSSGVLRSVEC
jgi:hypothetical protein